MAYSVDWLNLIVTIPKSDLTLVSASPEIYNIDVNDVWLALHDIQDSFAGMGYPPIMAGIPPTSFAPRGLVIDPSGAGWRIEFEDGPYTVNLINANSDIQENAIQNQVSIKDKTFTGASPAAFWSYLLEDSFTAEQMMRIILSATSGKASGAATTEMRFRDVADTKDRIVATVDEYGNRPSVTLDPS